MMRLHKVPCTLPSQSRSGVTLTEVLMSMLIMSLGIIFVATLFPASVIRSIQASHMTSATIARYNAEALIDTSPELIHDPDGDGDFAEHYQVNAVGDFARALTRNYIVDPYGFYTHQQDGSNTPESIHRWFGVKVADGEVQEDLHLLRRFDSGIVGDAEAAASLTFANDRWDRIVDVQQPNFELIPDAVNPIGVRVTDKSLSAVVPGISRIQIFDEYGRRSQTYPIVSVDLNDGDVFWDASGATPPTVGLPASFLPGPSSIGPSRIVIENDQRLFNWLLTVRKNSDGRANVDVVVTANRRIAPDNEHAYSALFNPGSAEVWVNSGALDTPSPAPEPFLKKGGYVFDVVNARWYRIQAFEFVSGPPAGFVGFPTDTFDIRLEIEGEVRAPGTNANLDGDSGGTFDGFAVLMPGIIDVFPLAPRPLPEFSE